MENFLKGRKQEEVLQTGQADPEVLTSFTLPDAHALSAIPHGQSDIVVVDAPEDPDSGESPAVEAVVQHGRVTRLVVTCTCGKRLELECVYGDH